MRTAKIYLNPMLDTTNSNLLEDSFSYATGIKFLDDAFSNVKKKKNAVDEKIKKGLSDAEDNIKETASKVKISTEDWKKISGNWNKFNPAATIPRAAGLALVRLNFLGFARKYHPALLSTSELKAKHYNLENAAVVKKVWDTQIKPHWEALGGNISSLEKATRQGFDKPVFKTKKVKAAKRSEQGSSFDGDDSNLSPFNKWANGFDLSVADNEFNNLFDKEYHNDVDPTVIAALIAAGGGIIVAALNAKGKQAGVKDNPYDPSSPEYQKAQLDPPPSAPPLTPQDEDQLKAIEMAALEDRKKNGLDDATYESEYNAIERKYSDKILGIPKTGFYIGLGAVVLIGVFLLYKKFKK